MRRIRERTAVDPPPRTKRSFISAWEEIGYLYGKLIYWFYVRYGSGNARARRYTGRLRRLLRKADPRHETVKGEECWSLLYELDGKLRAAIRHRRREIELMARALARAKARGEPRTTDWDTYEDLADRHVLLAMLHDEAGATDEGVESLRTAQRLARAHGFRFDAGDLLRRYERVSNTPSAPRPSGRGASGSTRARRPARATAP
jgi:hypothetical protein